MVTALRQLTGPVAAVAAALVAAFAAGSASPMPAEALRAIATVAGALCVGFCILIHWARPTSTSTTTEAVQTWRPLALWAGLWFTATALSFLLTASELANVTPSTLTGAHLGSLLHTTTLGQWGLVSVVCPILLMVISIDAARGGVGWHPLVVGGVAVLGLLAPPVSGHMSVTTIGSVVIGIHAAAAALWLGPLLAALMTLRTTTAWTRFLPRYSRLAWWCAIGVTTSGIAALTLRLVSSPTSDTYVVLAATKGLLLIALLAGGYRLRRIWVGRRCAVTTSLRHAIIETTVMASTVGIAATLSFTP